MAEPEYLHNADSVHAKAAALEIVLMEIVKLISMRDPAFRQELVGAVDVILSNLQRTDDLPYNSVISRQSLLEKSLRDLQTNLRNLV